MVQNLQASDLSVMFKYLFKKLDRQKYPFVDGIYYLLMIILLIIGILIIK